MLEVIVSYVAGTAAGGLLFQQWITERAITRTLDLLIQEDYVRSWIDEEGTVQLYKWEEEEPEISEEEWRRLEGVIREAQKDPAMDKILEDIIEEENETDDTP
jgi:hypothetical protein